MKKQWGLKLCAFVLVINLVLTVLLICGVFPQKKNAEGITTAYVLYIGTQDAETKTQLIPTQEAIGIVNEICNKHVTGYTTMTGWGGWDDGSGEWVHEETLIYTFVGAEEEDVLKIKDEALVALNQNAILLETREVSSTYFYR